MVYVYDGGGRGNLRENREDPTPTVGVGGESDPIKTMRHWLGRVFVGGQATHGLPLQRCSYAMIWMMGVYGGGGRGNLRENREDPAPTVGVGGEGDPIKNDATLVRASTRYTRQHPYQERNSKARQRAATIPINPHLPAARPLAFPARRAGLHAAP